MARGVYELGQGVIGKVVASGQPIIVPKIGEEPAFLNRTGSRSLAEQRLSFLCVPIVRGKKVLGTISAERLYDNRRLLSLDADILSILAAATAQAVELHLRETVQKTALEDENRRLRSALQAQFKPANLIGQSPPMQAVYRLIRAHYLAQFLPNHEYDRTQADFDCAGHALRAVGKRIVEPGWKRALPEALTPPKGKEAPPPQALPALHKDLNEDTRTRKPYIGMIADENIRNMVRNRSKAVASLRKTFADHDFLEVETPMLQTVHGGAAARPFTTHMNAFDLDLYLRIAPELFLKRCLVGGIDRVFEINRDFRNEGVDATHAPEFTMVEAYQAYGNYDTIGALVKQLVQDTAMDVFGSHKVTLLDGTEYDFGGEWKTISMYDSLSESLGEEIVPNGGPDAPGTSVEHLGAIADKLGVERDDVENHGKLVEHLWEHFYEDKLYEPTFVRDFPVETSPLVKGHRSKAGVVEKWDLYVRGFELATGYSELNDPVVQRERFVAQAKDALAGDEEACDIDEDFLEALGVGMPPAGGMGMGIDRLLIALTGATIRETITFPLVKPLVG